MLFYSVKVLTLLYLLTQPMEITFRQTEKPSDMLQCKYSTLNEEHYHDAEQIV